MNFFFLKFFLGFVGIIMLTIFILSFLTLIKTIYFSDENLISYFFNINEICEEVNNKSTDHLCVNIATAYWMLFFSIISSILSFICLFPFFTIKKKFKKSL